MDSPAPLAPAPLTSFLSSPRTSLILSSSLLLTPSSHPLHPHTHPPQILEKKDPSGAASSSSSAFHHLYEDHTRRMEKGSGNVLTTAEREVAECTFKPTLETGKYRPRREVSSARESALRPPGYTQAVQRLRRVGEEKEQADEEAEREARRRAANAGKPPKPFNLQTEARGERRHPLLYMDVNLGPGRTGRIGLHGDDDPPSLAANFARAYGLDAAMQLKLEGLIERYLKEVVPDLASARGEGEEGATPMATPGDALRSPLAPEPMPLIS